MTGSLIAGGISQIALVMSGVVVARALGPEDRGYLALVLLVPGILVSVGTLGLPLGATYHLARLPQETGAIVRSLFGPACLQAVALVALQAVVVSIVFAGEPSRVGVAGLVALAFTPVLVAQHYGLAVLQGERRFRAFNILRTLPPLFYAAGVLCAVALFEPGLVEMMTVAVVTYACAAALILAAVLRRLPPAEGTQGASRSAMLKFGLKSFLGSLSPVENFRFDHIAVAVFLNPVALGFYVVAQAFVNLPRFVAQSIGMVAYPNVAASNDPDAARRSMWRYFVIGTVICLTVVALLEASVSRLVTFFFGGAFASAIPIAQILLLGAFFFGIRRVLADGARGAGRPIPGTVAEVASWIAVVPAVLLLAPRYGAEGVAWALALSWAIAFVVLLAAVVGRPVGIASELVRAGAAVPRQLARVGPPALMLGLASAAGLAVVVLPAPYVALAILAAIGLALSAISRKALRNRLLARGGDSRQLSTADVITPAVPDSADPRFARLLFFVGLALIGQLTLRPLPIATVSDWFFLAAFGAMAAFVIVRRMSVQIVIPPLMFYGFLLFAIGAVLSTFGSEYPTRSLSILLRLMFVTLIWSLLAAHVLRTQRHVMIAIALWVGSAALTGAAALVQLSFGDVIPGGSITWGRATGFTEGPNELGGVTSVALIPALMLATLPRTRALASAVAFVALAMIGAGLVVSGSVTAFIGVLVGAFIWFAGLPRIPGRSLVVVATVAVGAAALLSFQQSNESLTPFERFARVTGSEDDRNATLWTRLETYREAADRIASNPFVGVGLDPESAVVRDAEAQRDFEVHNFLISVWHRTGALGIIGMLVLLLAVMKAGLSASGAARSTAEQMSAHALLSAVSVYLVFGMGQPTLFSRYGWVAIVLLLSFRAVQTRELAQGERTTGRGTIGFVRSPYAGRVS